MPVIRVPLSLRNVEDLLDKRGVDVSHETVQYWWNRFGLMFAAEISWKRVQQLRVLQMQVERGRGFRAGNLQAALFLARF
jgi:transposase-like protein